MGCARLRAKARSTPHPERSGGPSRRRCADQLRSLAGKVCARPCVGCAATDVDVQAVCAHGGWGSLRLRCNEMGGVKCACSLSEGLYITSARRTGPYDSIPHFDHMHPCLAVRTSRVHVSGQPFTCRTLGQVHHLSTRAGRARPRSSPRWRPLSA
ncbi:hypothetical protein HYPSUDRAFT_441048 [Hypholoma sublateritium FD-334 SS-4]|uniref:Uncharacterized protein n=1 Tax=Hypholoma sublateritium (strain FD-334 SS-4) TaxID=945553 RepID=A0A0D2P2R4_HYPSF|nr:hypothetical protein HYPSUDRAFT_441048 [Hypholoma sublateritium FD-334 SS-4]